MKITGIPAQAYNNFVSNLVSQGFIVVGVNSLFLNGGISLSNGHIVTPPESYSDEQGRNENQGDLEFVVNNIEEIAAKVHLEKEMNFKNVALVGHSRGAMSIVNSIKQGLLYNIKAIILMDPGNLLKEKNYPIPSFKIPTLTIWSSKFKRDLHGASSLGKDDYEVILKAKEADVNFSDHLNFSDDSTLQYHPAYNIPLNEKILVGTGDGYKIASAINDYSIRFLSTYLKDKPDNDLLECKNVNFQFILKCGSGN